ncbi:hypothetical protein EA462_12745 [Natrarchaeobius halalkaliphilus]|uniref:Serine kinase n=1 Tax=Natrarchaeobius halalkaliphilus TaxID=1679091 RepID=A0A3N6LMW1_9EURY|nr:hypothetical protein [Natrarchaeobius halalkaliphilus]RQG89227.1 hypothetical protein EA462_12745 [Natrarchaeobius halalkaliphilus]
MTCYTAYGLTIRSAFDLPELPISARGDSSVDVVIRFGDVDPVPSSVPGEGGRRIEADSSVCRLSYETIGTFLVEEGKRVLFDPSPAFERRPGERPPKVVRRLLQNEMMGVLLHQRNALVLHASAVSVEGTGAVFLGPRGAGKSTTAAAFHAAGRTILEDDVVGIRFEESQPTVLPGVPQLRLLPDAVDALGVTGTTQPETDTDSKKRYKHLDVAPEPIPLGACYLLEEADHLEFGRLEPPDRVFQLISRTYTGGMLGETDATGVNFRQCSTVAETVPFRVLRRPKTHRSLSEVVDLVVADLRSLEKAPITESS